MAQEFTDFSEYTTGQAPSDWNGIYAGPTSDMEVQDDASLTGGKVLHIVSDNDGQQAYEWTGVGTSISDVEFVTKWRITQVGDTTDNTPRIWVRVDSSGSEDGYWWRHSGGDLDIGKYTEGVFSYVAENYQQFSLSTDTWYWVRFRANGDTIKARTWTDGDTEPTSWDVSATDSDHSSGGVAVGTFNSAIQEYDVVGVGTSGDTAPKSSPGGSVPTAPSNLQATLQ